MNCKPVDEQAVSFQKPPACSRGESSQNALVQRRQKLNVVARLGHML
jgi:hypothetical protein